jgi:hypothetical protein
LNRVTVTNMNRNPRRYPALAGGRVEKADRLRDIPLLPCHALPSTALISSGVRP